MQNYLNTKLQAIKLVETTSKTQKKNGTRCFSDVLMNVNYLSYASGYVRRTYTHTSYYTKSKQRVIYQLNKQKLVKSEYGNYMNTTRVLEHNPDIRLEIIIKSVANYRNNKNLMYLK